MAITLTCPLCGATVADGAADLAPGRCPGCQARFEGGLDNAHATVAAALEAYDAADLPPGEVAQNLFALSPDDDMSHRVAITSDQRDDFYRWWLFVREGPEGLHGTLACLTQRRHSGAG